EDGIRDFHVTGVQTCALPIWSSLPYAGVMGVTWEQLVVDAADPHALGRWWAEALGWVVVDESPDEMEIRPAPDRLPGLLFGADPGRKTGKNRLHLEDRKSVV